MTPIDELPGLLGYKDVTIGDLSLPVDRALNRAKRCSAAFLALKNNDSNWPFARYGTSTLVRFGSNHFAVATHHQKKVAEAGADAKPEDLFIIVDWREGKEKATVVNGRPIHWLEQRNDTEQRDMFVAEIPASQKALCNDNDTHFLKLSNIKSPRTDDKVWRYVIGYPDALETAEIDENIMDGYLHKNSHLKQVTAELKFTGTASGIHCYSHVPGPVFEGVQNYSGFSGSPIIAICRDSRTVSLEGMVIAGGSGNFRAIPAEVVERFCVAIIRGRQQ